MLGRVHVNELQSSIARRRQLGLMTGTRPKGETNEKVQGIHEVKTNVKLVKNMPLTWKVHPAISMYSHATVLRKGRYEPEFPDSSSPLSRSVPKMSNYQLAWPGNFGWPLSSVVSC